MRNLALGRVLRDLPLGIQMLLAGGTVFLALAFIKYGMPFLNDPVATPTVLLPQPQGTVAATLSVVSNQTPISTISPLSTPTPTTMPALLPPEGGNIYVLYPYADRAGWVVSDEERNHFGDSHLYAGIAADKVYHGAFQFDLSFLPPGSLIHYAVLELTGLDSEGLLRQGTWSVQILDMGVDVNWSAHGFEDIHQAGVIYTLSPVLDSVDLVEGETNRFVFDTGQRVELEKRISRGVISFRIDGSSTDIVSLFSWDSGYGDASLGLGPKLLLAIELPATTVTPDVERVTRLGTPTPTYVVITSVPTPKDRLTVAVQALTATAVATVEGTPTPLPPNWVTPMIVTNTPRPENEATATARVEDATVQAALTGTATPTPGNVWTATPTPTYVVVTIMPVPANTMTAVADALTATAVATVEGTPTLLPSSWVTPIVITATPTPKNYLTATAYSVDATVEILFTGTPTPTPVNLLIVTRDWTPAPD
jgi:hypothetical protein